MAGAGMGLLLAPVVFAGAAIGLPLGSRIPKAVLRRIVYLILVSIATWILNTVENRLSIPGFESPRV